MFDKMCLIEDGQNLTLEDSRVAPFAVTKLQIGASRLEQLDPRVLKTFLDKTWIHLGDPPKPSSETGLLKGHSVSHIIDRYRKRGISYVLNSTLKHIFRKSISEADATNMYDKTNFQEFYYRKGDRLPFDSSSISFIYSEHFFEHLFFDESLSLLRECYRILKPFGVIRTCVPDADLRTYAAPEPVGFPSTKYSFESANKHKTRWSVYLLAEAITIAGFDAIPLRYCNRSGEYIKITSSDIVDSHEGCLEQELILDVSYVQKIDSLIVDGIKRMSK